MFLKMNARFEENLAGTTYSFDGHDWTSELSGHLQFLLLKRLHTVHSSRKQTRIHCAQRGWNTPTTCEGKWLGGQGRENSVWFTWWFSTTAANLKTDQTDAYSGNTEVLNLNEFMVSCVGIRYFQSREAVFGPCMSLTLQVLCGVLFISWIILEKPSNSSPHGWISFQMWLNLSSVVCPLFH